VIAGIKRDLHAIEFRQHAEQVAFVIDDGSSGDAVLYERVYGVQHIRLGFERNERARHVVFDDAGFNRH
jgi:hypothetical protein